MVVACDEATPRLGGQIRMGKPLFIGGIPSTRSLDELRPDPNLNRIQSTNFRDRIDWRMNSVLELEMNSTPVWLIDRVGQPLA
jgi:hypothetical protein